MKDPAFKLLIIDNEPVHWKDKAIEQKKQSIELGRYRKELEKIIEERTIELIGMYSKLQESEANFRNIFNSSNDGIIIVGYNL